MIKKVYRDKFTKMKNRTDSFSHNIIKKVKKFLKSKSTIWTVKILSIIIIFHLAYSIYSFIKYNQIPINKKDIKVKSIIKSKFPYDYDVNIKFADLVGLGDKFYVAYGNNKYMKNAYFFKGDSAIKNLKSNFGKLNLPILKIFYIQEPSLITSLFSFTPFSDLVNSNFELSIKEFGTYCYIPQDTSDFHINILEYNSNYRFPTTFLINNVVISDIDEDSKEEIIVNYLSYSGGSGGIKYSLIFQFVYDKLKITSGFPDMIDINFSSFLQAIYKYSGVYRIKDRNLRSLASTLDLFSHLYHIDSLNKKLIATSILPEDQLISILLESNGTGPSDNISLIDYYTQNTVNLYPRHTDNYSQFVNIDGRMIFIDAFYIYDENCHWCPHYWRIMSFLSKDGRWISDRNINGNLFSGVWWKNRTY